MFILTTDKEIIDKLISLKYPIMRKTEKEDGTIYCFKNINRLVFSHKESKKIIYTNKLFF